MSSQPQPLPTRRVKKRVLIPCLMLLLLVAFVGWIWVRGTWADPNVKNPTSSADGIVTQLHQTSAGQKQVRCALVLDFPMKDVWAVLTDYEHFAEIFPTLSSAQYSVGADGRHQLTGTVPSPVGAWKFATNVKHEETSEKCVASWDDHGEEILLTRGSWTVTPTGKNSTLLVHALEVELEHYPTFVVRNVLLSRQKGVIGAVAERLKKQSAGK